MSFGVMCVTPHSSLVTVLLTSKFGLSFSPLVTRHLSLFFFDLGLWTSDFGSCFSSLITRHSSLLLIALGFESANLRENLRLQRRNPALRLLRSPDINSVRGPQSCALRQPASGLVTSPPATNGGHFTSRPVRGAHLPQRNAQLPRSPEGNLFVPGS